MRWCTAAGLATVLAAPCPPVLAGTAAARALRVILVADPDVREVDLTPAGQAAAREGQRLRARFLAALGKASEVVLVSDDDAADARLEIREAAVHHRSRTETTSKRGGGRQPSGPRQFIVETQEEVGVSASDEREFALTVRLTAGESFADFTSAATEPSAASAADTMVRAMRRWVRDHRREPLRRR